MKTILLLFVLTIVGQCQESHLTYFLEPKNEETDYDRICTDRNITINFSGLNLDYIKENFLSSPIITCLDLSSNNIRTVDHNAFINLPNIKYLNMSGNTFKLEDIFSFGHINVETLLIDNNGHLLNNWNRNIYDRFCQSNDDGSTYHTNENMYEIRIQTIYPKLKKLFLKNHNSILKFTANSKINFPSLTHLYLSGSTIVHDDFNWLPNTLEYLDLSGHNLETLTLTDLNNLKWIYLDNPVAKCLHRVYFKNLTSLKYLSLPSNSINEITHETFANVNSLLFLDLADNDIRYVEGGSFDSMKNLQFLNLSKNNIETIQGGTFDKLKHLQTLALENNLISMFPMISNEINLKMLSLNCNNLKSIVGGIFAKMPYLETLYLHGNDIMYIDQEAFAGLKNLRILTLSDNQLSSLPNNWLQPMINLQKLDLSENYIVDFGHLSLGDSSPLQYLYLSNQVEVIKSLSLLENVPENVTISLKANDTFIKKCVKEDKKYNSRRTLYG